MGSFGIAGMGAATLFFWLQLPNLTKTYRTPLIITGLVTAIATYHYVRIFNSWVNAFELKQTDDSYAVSLSGVPFNDAYRYVDWLLTVPLLLIELILVMRLLAEESASLSWKLGASSAIMVALGYPGDPERPRRTLVLVGVRNGTLCLRCDNPGHGPERSHTETALLCAGARDPGAIPHGDLLVDVSVRLHHQERGYLRPSRNHMGAGRLLRGGLLRKGSLRRLDLGHRGGKVQVGGGRVSAKVSAAAPILW